MKIIPKSAESIAAFLNGRVEGNPDRVVSFIGEIDDESITDSLCFMANPKYEKYLYSSSSKTILIKEGFKPKETADITLIYVDDVYGSFSKVLNEYSAKKAKKNINDPLSHVASTAKISEAVGIGKFSIVGDMSIIGRHSVIHDQVYIGSFVEIGERVTIYPGARILNRSVIGNDVIIHSNSVIGSDGFGFSPKENGYQKIPQVGNVIIEDDVEIGSNCSIDRATIGSTVIKKGAKLDNLIQIGHNVVIGENTVIAAQTGIAGSSEIGKGSMLGGQVGISGHITIAPYSQIQAKSGVASSIVEKGKKWYGYPIIPYTSYLRSFAIFKMLPSILMRISKLEDAIRK